MAVDDIRGLPNMPWTHECVSGPRRFTRKHNPGRNISSGRQEVTVNQECCCIYLAVISVRTLSKWRLCFEFSFWHVGFGIGRASIVLVISETQWL